MIDPARGEKLGNFAECDVWITGDWAETFFGKARWQGTVTCAVPVRMLAIEGYGANAVYSKWPGRIEPGAGLEIWQGVPDRPEHVYVRPGHSRKTNSPADAGRILRPSTPVVPPTLLCKTGWLTVWVRSDEGVPVVRLLALASNDTRTRRCGIWCAKPRLWEMIVPIWRPALTRTRWGLPPID